MTSPENPRLGTSTTVVAILIALAVIGSSIYTEHFPDSFFGRLYGAFGLQGFHNVIGIGAAIVIFIFVIGKHVLGKWRKDD